MISTSVISVIIVWLFVILFFVLTLLKRKKIHILSSISLTVCILFISFFSQSGKVLLTIGSFRITTEALLTGLRRSGILTGMVFLSQLFVTSELKLPGKAGNFLKEVFTSLEQLTSIKINFKPGHIIESIDARLCQLWNIQIQNKDNPND